MTDTYRIYLVNQSADLQHFWCFLAPPQELGDDPGVFANSSLWLAVPRYFTGTCQFNIPVSYVFGAGAGSQKVGPGASIVSTGINSAHLGDTWYAAYADAPPNDFPTLAKAATAQGPDAIAIETNGYDLNSNEREGWFSNQSFGIQVESGFLGVTWWPQPNTIRTITPEARFLITVGNFGSNVLASWDEVSGKGATLDAPASFDALNICTVTYTDSGKWVVTAGRPADSGPA